MPQANETDEDRRRRLDLRRRRLDLGTGLSQREIGSTDPSTSTFQATEDVLQNRADLAADTPSPGLVGAGKFFSDASIGLQQRALLMKDFFRRFAAATVGGAGLDAFDADNVVLRNMAEDDQEKFISLYQTAADNQELFNILNQRSPEAGAWEVLTGAASALVIPASRTAGGRVLTGPRRATAGSEALAGGAIASTIPIPDETTAAITTVGGLLIGPTIFMLGRGVSNSGRQFVGGSPQTIETTADLLQAERNLSAVGLLTTGEIRGGGILSRVEGVFDNMPLPGIGMSARREGQRQMFRNAVLHIRSAFPGMTEEQALRVISVSLQKNQKINAALYRRVAESIPENAPPVRPTHYNYEAARLLAQEKAKGNRASQATIKWLEEQSQSTAVSFDGARQISSDLGETIRVAQRAAEDPAKTGVRAGAAKQLAAAHARDIETWAQEVGGETLALWKVANDDFVRNVLPFSKRPLAPLFDENGFDSATLAKALMKPSTAKELAKLDRENAMGFLYIHDAIRRSTKAGHVDPKRLAAILDNAENQRAAAEHVSDEIREMIQGFVKLVDAAPRAFINPRASRVIGTTVGTGVALGTAGVLGGEDVALGGVVGLGAMRFFVGTQAGRAMLTTAARTDPAKRELLSQMAMRASLVYNRFAQTASIDTFRDQPQIPLQSQSNVEPVQ